MLIGLAFGIYTWVVTGQLDDKGEMVSAVEPLFIWTYILVVVAILALIVVPLPYMLKNPKTMKKFGIGIIALAVVILLAYMLSSDNSLPFIENAASKNEWSRWADINIISIYIMSGAAILAIIVSGIGSRLISKK